MKRASLNLGALLLVSMLSNISLGAGAPLCSEIFQPTPMSAADKANLAYLKDIQGKSSIPDLEVAKQSKNISIVTLKSGLEIEGKFKDVIVDPETQNPVYIQFVGETQISENGSILPRQAKENHKEGYGTAIGNIVQAKDSRGQTVKLGDLKTGEEVALVYDSGLIVNGHLDVILKSEVSKQQVILSFKTAQVEYQGKQLFTHKMGRFDLALAAEVSDVVVTGRKAVFSTAYHNFIYKSDVSGIKKNSYNYYLEIKQKFENQKKLMPERPYGFAFNEFKSTLNYMVDETGNRIDMYNGPHGLYWRKKERVVRGIYSFFGRKAKLQEQKESLEAELELLKLIKKDLVDLQEQKDLPYDSLVRMSYFFTKAMQSTEKAKRAPFRMIPYELYMLSNYKAAKQELELYKKEMMEFSGGKRFQVNESKIFNPEKLEVVIVPVVGALLSSDLAATRNVPVHFATVSGQYLRADGFVLNPYTLFLHDIYFHAGMREKADEIYYKKRGFNNEQIEDFRKQQQLWIEDFLVELKKHPDQKMRSAIAQVAQTVIHDRGDVFAPSTFNDNKFRNYYFIMKGEFYVAAWGQRNKGIGENMLQVSQRMDAAYKWTLDFWSKYKNSPY